MADIFISYASEDRDRIAVIVGALEKAGWKVFWDRKTPVGTSWEKHIERNLQRAACVLVVWSTISVDKDWVKIEARNGLGRGCLVPARIDAVAPPFGFDHVQFADLVGWTGDTTHPEWHELITAVDLLVPRDTPAELQPGPSVPDSQGPPPMDLSAYWQQLLKNPSLSELQQLADEIQALRDTRPTEPNLIRIQRRIADALESAKQQGVSSRSRKSARWPVWLIAIVVMLAGAAVVVSRYFLHPPPPQENSGVPDNAEPTIESENEIKKTAQASQRLQNIPLPVLVSIPKGCFIMGSPKGEAGREQNEGPQHEVCLEGFRMGRREITFDEYDAFARTTGYMLPLDKDWGRGDRPVINASWEEARAYTNWLSIQLGLACSLPSEAQWEYAARAKTTGRYALPPPMGSDSIEGKALANCRGCGSQWDGIRTAPVGSFKPNAWGLHDMHGNVWEWVQDCWHDNYLHAPADGSAWEEADGGICAYRVLRGGSWEYFLEDARSADRERYVSDSRGYFTGFRVVCSDS